jgi:predicted  nucleic acid-binding Zn-ribbon protein
MTLTRPQGSLQAIIQNWKDQIICFSPKGEGYSAYLVDGKNSNLINYLHASCDELRHLATNYDSLLTKIKNEHDGYLKEAVLNTIKYEATRRAFKKQHEWIQDSYKNLIEQKQLTAEQQETEIKQLKQIITEQKQEIATIKSECRGELAALQAENSLKQKEAKIEQQNQEIAQLNQQLQECDRQISDLQTELNQGLHELKLKYKWLIAQFIQERAARQKIDHNNKSLQACQNLFKKAQQKIQLLQCENKLLKQENINLSLQSPTKLLRI